jgi:hypothetical protein
LITNAGKDHLVKYQARIVPEPANYIALGVGTTAAAGTDIALAFEVERIPVASTNADISNDRIVLSGAIPIQTINTIYEIGLYYSNLTSSLTKTLPLPGTDISLWTNATMTPTNARVSPQALKVDFVTSGTTTAEYLAAFLDFS